MPRGIPGSAASQKEQLYCPKCRMTKSEDNFYTHKNGKRAELCKACQTMHINNWDPETFTWLLKEFDVPYIKAEWDVLRDRYYQKDPLKMNGMTIFGRYLGKMKLKQWSNFSWADSDELNAKNEEIAKMYAAGVGPQDTADFSPERIKEIQEQYDRGEISEAQYLTLTEMAEPSKKDVYVSPFKDGEMPAAGRPEDSSSSDMGIYPTNANPFVKVDLPDVGADLTEDDMKYLAMKWGRLYTPADWVELEKFYNEMKSTFTIQGAAREDTLKHICKISLKANAALDTGDIDSYQKLMKVYDAQMKSAKFTEAQNKEKDSQIFDSIGLLAELCEKEGGFIPAWEIAAPQDVVDTIIKDNQEYLRSLVYGDTNLAQQIEQYLKKREISEQMDRDLAIAKEKGMDSVELTVEDYEAQRIATEEEIRKDREQYYDDVSLVEEFNQQEDEE